MEKIKPEPNEATKIVFGGLITVANIKSFGWAICHVAAYEAHADGVCPRSAGGSYAVLRHVK